MSDITAIVGRTAMAMVKKIICGLRSRKKGSCFIGDAYLVHGQVGVEIPSIGRDRGKLLLARTERERRGNIQ